MIKRTTLILVLLSSSVFGQITVSDNNILSTGDVFYLFEPDSISSLISPGIAGANQYWDFSSIQVENIEISQCVDPNMTPHSSYYPNSNLCIEEDNSFLYFNKSTTIVEFLGEGDSVFQQPLALLPLPLTYGATFTSGPVLALDSLIGGGIVNILLNSQGLTAAGISGGLAQVADSIKIEAGITSNFNVDAWGTITIPMGTFDCLRLKIERTTNTQIQVFCTDTITSTGSGWYSVPNSLLPFVDLEVEISYQWWSNNNSTKFSLVEMTVDSLNNIEGNIIVLHNTINSIKKVNIDFIKVYPIPSNKKLIIEGTFSESNYKIYNLNGKLISHSSFYNNTKIDLGTIAKGHYLLEITTNSGSNTRKIIIE